MKTLTLFASVLLLVSCTNPPTVQGEFIGKDGQIKVYPDGRFEIIVSPRTSK
jgi:hypothetical protein